MAEDVDGDAGDSVAGLELVIQCGGGVGEPVGYRVSGDGEHGVDGLGLLAACAAAAERAGHAAAPIPASAASSRMWSSRDARAASRSPVTSMTTPPQVSQQTSKTRRMVTL